MEPKNSEGQQVKTKTQKGVGNWPTLKLISIVYGSFILFFILLFVMATLKSQVVGYVVFALYIILGLAMVIKAEDIGSAIFEANQRMLKAVWKRVFLMKNASIEKRLRDTESGPLGYKFHIGITLVIGLGLIAISIWSIFMLVQGKMY